MRKINKALVHCSASDKSEQDSIDAIKELHTGPKTRKINWGEYGNVACFEWSDVGYHFVITTDGTVHFGRPIEIKGAHCPPENAHSIGICLTGNKAFSPAQFEALRFLASDLCHEFNLNLTDFYPHNHFDKNKTCPNFDVQKVLKAA